MSETTKKKRQISVQRKWIRTIQKSELPATLRSILLHLAEKMNRDGSRCYPTQEQIAQATGYTRETVNRWLKKAVSMGWLRVIQNKWGKKWRNNLYIPRNPESESCTVNRVTFTNTTETRQDHTTNTLRVQNKPLTETLPEIAEKSNPKTEEKPKSRWHNHAKPIPDVKSPPLNVYKRPLGEKMIDGMIYRVPLSDPKTGKKWINPSRLAEAMLGADYFHRVGDRVKGMFGGDSYGTA